MFDVSAGYDLFGADSLTLFAGDNVVRTPIVLSKPHSTEIRKL